MPILLPLSIDIQMPREAVDHDGGELLLDEGMDVFDHVFGDVVIVGNPFERNLLLDVCDLVDVGTFCDAHIRIITDTLQNDDLAGFALEGCLYG